MKKFFILCAVLTLLVPWRAEAGKIKNEPDPKIKKSGWIGVSVRDVDKKIAKKENLKNDHGAYVTDVVDDSPADSAGLSCGDVVIRFAEQTIEDADDLVRAVRKSMPGTDASILVVRNGGEKKFSLKVGTYRVKRDFGSRRRTILPVMPFLFHEQVLGMKLLPLNEQLGEYFGAPEGEGVLVEEVAKGSSAERAGLKAGDVVLQAGKRTVRQTEDVLREVRKCDEGDTLAVGILRRGERKTISVQVEENDTEMRGLRFSVPEFPIPENLDNDREEDCGF